MAPALAALVFASLFASAALYITLVEHPARLELGDASLLAQWQPSYKRALPIQAGLAVLGGVAGLVAWSQLHDWRWMAGGIAMLSNWPVTLLVIMPTNKRLLAMSLEEAGAESRALLQRWGSLHNVRSALGLVAVVLFCWAWLTP